MIPQSPPPPNSMNQGMQANDPNQGKGAKLLALQNILGGIAEISDDEMRPYIEQAMQQIHLSHEEGEGDQMGAQDASDAMHPDGSDTPGMDITVGMGNPSDDMSSDSDSDSNSTSDDEDEGKPKGFLAILAKKMGKK